MSFPKEGIPLNLENFDQIGDIVRPQLEKGKTYRMTLVPWRDRRTLGQNALSHVWYAEISAFLIKRGKAFASPEWVKDAMKHTYLGWEEKEVVDVITGEISVVKTLRHTSDLKTGAMHDYLSKVEAWAANFGCLVSVPHDCEYMTLKNKQVE